MQSNDRQFSIDKAQLGHVSEHINMFFLITLDSFLSVKTVQRQGLSYSGGFQKCPKGNVVKGQILAMQWVIFRKKYFGSKVFTIAWTLS